MKKVKLNAKRTLSLFISLLMLTSVFFSMQMSVSGFEGEPVWGETDDGFEYYIDEDMTAYITGYKGSSVNVNFPSYIEGCKVTGINNDDESVFKNNKNIKSVTIPDTVTRLGSYVFKDCISLENVDFGHGLKNLGDDIYYSWAFENCQSLKEITIPEQMEYIRGNPFEGCVNLTTINLRAQSIDDFGFLKELPSLENINIGSTVESLPSESFLGMRTIKNVTFENGIRMIPNKCFYGCTGIENITLPSGLLSIGESAFGNCFNMKAVNIPDSVNLIDESAFKGCKSLVSVRLNKNLRTLSNSAFEDCSSLRTVNFNSDLKAIGEKAFYNCSSLLVATLPSSVTTVGDSAFQNCSKLESAGLSNDMYEIKDNLFYNCSSLKTISFPDNITKIGQESFYNCTSLESVNFGKNVTVIGYKAFQKCSKLDNVVIPSNIKTVGELSFDNCTNLEELTIQNGVANIDNYAFYNCLNLKYVKIPEKTELNEDGYSFGFYGNEESSYKVPDFVIKGYYNTSAYYYASSNGITFRDISLPDVESIKITDSNVVLGRGETYTLSKSVTPANVVATYSWSSSDNNVVTVDNNGKLIAKSVGSAIVKVKANNGKKAECSVTVKKQPDSITLSNNNIEINKGSSAYISASLPADTSSKIYWSSTNASVVTVDNGTIIARGIGEATIIASTYNGKRATCNVKVVTHVKSLNLSDKSITLGNNEKYNLGREINPPEAESMCHWSSSNELVATVDQNGKVTAKSYGVTVITLESNNKLLKDTCVVNVKYEPIYLDLNKNKETLSLSETLQLNVIYPENAAGNIKWSTSNINVATVNNGFVEPKSVGTVNITATAYNGVSTYCTINVVDVPSNVELSKTELTLGCGERYVLKSNIDYLYSKRYFYWTSSDENVACVDEYGSVFAKSTGTATITYQVNDRIKAECTVTVNNAPSRIYLNTVNKTMKKGEKLSLYANYSPRDAVGEYTWSSSDYSVATVNDGIVVAKSCGTATITVTAYNGVTDNCYIEVVSPPDWIKLNKSSVILGVGQKTTVKSTISPGSSSNIVWSSGNSSIATVKNGQIVAKKAGTVKITAKTYNGKTATCKVTVKGAPRWVKLSKSKLSLGKNDTYALKVKLPSNTLNTVTWYSSNKSVVTVNKGKLSTKKPGTATIKVKTYNGKTATCKVTVLNGKRKAYVTKLKNKTIAKWTVVIPDSCIVKIKSGNINIYAKRNYNSYGKGYICSIFPTKKWNNTGTKCYKLGQKKGYYFGCEFTTGIHMAPNKSMQKSWNSAYKDIDKTVKSFTIL